jgi:hypothetical protein
MTGRWMHDMYEADSDEEKGKLYKSKSHKPKGQKKVKVFSFVVWLAC